MALVPFSFVEGTVCRSLLFPFFVRSLCAYCSNACAKCIGLIWQDFAVHYCKGAFQSCLFVDFACFSVKKFRFINGRRYCSMRESVSDFPWKIFSDVYFAWQQIYISVRIFAYKLHWASAKRLNEPKNRYLFPTSVFCENFPQTLALTRQSTNYSNYLCVLQ